MLPDLFFLIKVNYSCSLCLQIGVYTLYGGQIQFSVWACPVQVAPVASPADWEAAHHLGLQDPLPGCAVPTGCRQVPICGCGSGELSKAGFQQCKLRALEFLFLFKWFYLSIQWCVHVCRCLRVSTWLCVCACVVLCVHQRVAIRDLEEKGSWACKPTYMITVGSVPKVVKSSSMKSTN